MAWFTCPYCQKRSNGTYLAGDHKRREHPQGYALERAKQRVSRAEQLLGIIQTKADEYAALTAYLAKHPDMPECVRAALIDAQTAHLIYRRSEYTSDFAPTIREWEEEVTAAKAALTELVAVTI